jgi:hypothetical protein
MPNKASLRTFRQNFDRRWKSAKDLFEAVRPLAVGDWNSIKGWAALYPGQARHVTALSFMHLVIGWEDLVEASFLRYLVGGASPSNWKANLRVGPAASIDHAYQLISGSPGFRRGTDFLLWSDWTRVIALARVFFVDGEPFSLLTPLERDRLHDAVTIRNRVAHSSTKTRKEFIELARRHLGIEQNRKLSQGFSVG